MVIKNLKKHFNKVKLCSIFTTICFLVSTIGTNLYAIPISKKSDKNYESIFNKASSVSAEYGKITSVVDAKSDITIVNIQDLHCHFQVQKNISQIIKQLSNKYNLKSVYVEGGYGDIDTSWLNSIKNNNVKQQIIEKLLQEGILTGSEYYKLTNKDSKIELKGIDDEILHKDNLKRLSWLMENQTKYEQILSSIHKEINLLEQEYINSRNKRFNRNIENYLSNKTDTIKFYRQLVKYVNEINKNPEKYNNILPINLDNYPNLLKFIRLTKTSQNINIREVTKQLQLVIIDLKSKIPYTVYTKLLKETENLSDSQKLVELVLALCEKESIDLDNKYKDLKSFFESNNLSRQLNSVKLVQEENGLIEQIRAALSYNNEEYEITYVIDFFKYFQNYLEYKLTEADWKYFEKGFNKFRKIYAKYAVIDRIENISKDFKEINKYYSINDARNNIFVKNLLSKTGPQSIHLENKRQETEILKNSKEIIVAVTGGFHSGALEEILEKENVNSIVITPNIYEGIEKATKKYKGIIREQSKEFQHQALAYIIISCISNIEKRKIFLSILKDLLKENPSILKDVKEIFGNSINIEKLNEEIDELNETEINQEEKKEIKNIINVAVKQLTDGFNDIINLDIDKIMLNFVSKLIEHGIHFSKGTIYEIENSQYNGIDLKGIPAEIYSRMLPSLQKALLATVQEKAPEFNIEHDFDIKEIRNYGVSSIFKLTDKKTKKVYYLKHSDTKEEVETTKAAYNFFGNSGIVQSAKVVEDNQDVLNAFTKKIGLYDSYGKYWFVTEEIEANFNFYDIINTSYEYFLQDCLKNKPITIKEQDEIIESIKELNDSGIIHGDLISNIFIRRRDDGQLIVNIIDYEFDIKQLSAEEIETLRKLDENNINDFLIECRSRGYANVIEDNDLSIFSSLKNKNKVFSWLDKNAHVWEEIIFRTLPTAICLLPFLQPYIFAISLIPLIFSVSKIIVDWIKGKDTYNLKDILNKKENNSLLKISLLVLPIFVVSYINPLLSFVVSQVLFVLAHKIIGSSVYKVLNTRQIISIITQSYPFFSLIEVNDGKIVSAEIDGEKITNPIYAENKLKNLGVSLRYKNGALQNISVSPGIKIEGYELDKNIISDLNKGHFSEKELEVLYKDTQTKDFVDVYLDEDIDKVVNSIYEAITTKDDTTEGKLIILHWFNKNYDIHKLTDGQLLYLYNRLNVNISLISQKLITKFNTNKLEQSIRNKSFYLQSAEDFDYFIQETLKNVLTHGFNGDFSDNNVIGFYIKTNKDNEIESFYTYNRKNNQETINPRFEQFMQKVGISGLHTGSKLMKANPFKKTDTEIIDGIFYKNIIFENIEQNTIESAEQNYISTVKQIGKELNVVDKNKQSISKSTIKLSLFYVPMIMLSILQLSGLVLLPTIVIDISLIITSTIFAIIWHYKYNKQHRVPLSMINGVVDNSRFEILKQLKYREAEIISPIISTGIENLKESLSSDYNIEKLKDVLLSGVISSTRTTNIYTIPFEASRTKVERIVKKIARTIEEQLTKVLNNAEHNISIEDGIANNINSINEYALIIDRIKELYDNIEHLNQIDKSITSEEVIFDLKSRFASLLENEFCNAIVGVEFDKEQGKFVARDGFGIYNDPVTKCHVANVAKYSDKIFEKIPSIKNDFRVRIEVIVSAILHDIGKNLIPNEILNKPGKLTDEEMNIMKLHTLLGGLILDGSVLKKYSDVAKDHHSKYNKEENGYYNYSTILKQLFMKILKDSNFNSSEINDVLDILDINLNVELDSIKLENILDTALKPSEWSITADIVAVADVYEALIADRPYKKGMPPSEAFRIIVGKTVDEVADKGIGIIDFKNHQYNQEVLEAFIKWYFEEFTYEVFSKKVEENSGEVYFQEDLNRMINRLKFGDTSNNINWYQDDIVLLSDILSEVSINREIKINTSSGIQVKPKGKDIALKFVDGQWQFVDIDELEYKEIKQEANYMQIVVLLQRTSNVAIQLESIIEKLVIGKSAIKHIAIDFKYIKVSEIKKSTETFEKNIKFNDNGEIEISSVPVMIIDDLDKANEEYELENTGLKINGTSIYKVKIEGKLIYGANGVNKIEIMKALTSSEQVKKDIEKMIQVYTGKNIDVELEGIIQGNQGLSFDDSITIIEEQELKGKSYKYIQDYISSVMKIKSIVGIMYSQKIVVSLESITDRNELLQAITNGKFRKIITKTQYDQLELTKDDITKLKEQSIELYIDTSEELEKYQEDGLAGQIIRETSIDKHSKEKVYMLDYFSKEKVEMEVISDDESRESIKNKIINSQNPLLINIDTLKKTFTIKGFEEITDISKTFDTFIGNIKLKFGIGDIKERDVENIVYGLDFDILPTLKYISEEEFISLSLDSLIKKLEIQENSEIAILAKSIKEDLKNSFANILKERILAKTRLVNKGKTFGLKDKRLEVLLGKMLVKQITNTDKEHVNIDGKTFNGKAERIINKIMEEQLKAAQGNEIAVNTIIEIILVYADDNRKQIQKESKVDIIKSSKAMLAAA